MTKIKKIAAAAAAVLAIGVIGVTAFADAAPQALYTHHYFHFEMGDPNNNYSGDGFSESATKESPNRLRAEVLVTAGDPAPSLAEPVTFFVNTYPNTSLKYRASETTEFTKLGAVTGYPKTMEYLPGYGIKGDDYFLVGSCGEYYLDISGWWCP